MLERCCLSVVFYIAKTFHQKIVSGILHSRNIPPENSQWYFTQQKHSTRKLSQKRGKLSSFRSSLETLLFLKKLLFSPIAPRFKCLCLCIESVLFVLVFCTPLSRVRNSGHLIWVRHGSCRTSATHSCQCVCAIFLCPDNGITASVWNF